MARIPQLKDIDFCFHPKKIRVGDEFMYVPCGVCSGCLLQKANEWSMRLTNEIEGSPCAIFFTLTYSNDYLPVLRSSYHQELKYRKDIAVRSKSEKRKYDWFSSSFNCRAIPVYLRDEEGNETDVIIGCRDVPRYDYLYVDNPDNNISSVFVENWHDVSVIPYLSKRDLQLYIKLVRKHLQLHYGRSVRLRYFTFSEYGETKYRPHHHVLFFPESAEVAEFLFEYSLYQNWQMCSKAVFMSNDNLKYVESGISEYLTNYVTSFINLPEVYKLPRLKPFRLASKNPPIGFCSFSREEVFANVADGSIEYDKAIERISKRSILEYSTNYISTLFPKCKGFSQLDFYGLLRVYGLFVAIDRLESLGFGCYRGLFASLDLDPQDKTAARKCEQILLSCHSWSVFNYCFLLDNVYYLKAMSSLKRQYEYQEQNGFTLDVARSYNNFYEYLSLLENGLLSSEMRYTLDWFLYPLGYDCYSILEEMPSARLMAQKPRNTLYEREVEGILQDCVKMPKLNENLGLSPQCQFK